MRSTHMLAALTAVTICAAASADGGPYPVGNEINAPKSRAQVVAEMREAQRLGVMPSVGEGDPPFTSAEQEKLIADAGKPATGAQGPLAGNRGWSSYRDYAFSANSNEIQNADSSKAREIAAYVNANSSRQVGLDGSNPSRVIVVRDALIVAGVPAAKIQSGDFGDPQARRDGRVGVLISN